MIPKGIIFDYGGTLDSHGDHWSEVILDAYREIGINPAWEDFKEAYVTAERRLATQYIVRPEFTFGDVMAAKVSVQMEVLAARGVIPMADAQPLAERIARTCATKARTCVEEATPILKQLAARYDMALVSNFYGNIMTVLHDFGIRRFFNHVIESAVVGVRKPDPAIFLMACVAMHLQPSEVLVVGDSLSKDILPARSLGCATAFIAGRQWREDAESELTDIQPTSLEAIAAGLL